MGSQLVPQARTILLPQTERQTDRQTCIPSALLASSPRASASVTWGSKEVWPQVTGPGLPHLPQHLRSGTVDTDVTTHTSMHPCP